MDRDNVHEQPATTDEGAETGPRYSRGPRPIIRIAISDAKQINYKNVEFLRQFVTDRGKLRPRRQTGITAHQQRLISRAVKRARHLALLPFDRDYQ